MDGGVRGVDKTASRELQGAVGYRRLQQTPSAIKRFVVSGRADGGETWG